jgi:hypothetical protein
MDRDRFRTRAGICGGARSRSALGPGVGTLNAVSPGLGFQVIKVLHYKRKAAFYEWRFAINSRTLGTNS